MLICSVMAVGGNRGNGQARRSLAPFGPPFGEGPVPKTVSLGMPLLLGRYEGRFARLAAKGVGPWREQPLHPDLNLTESVVRSHVVKAIDIPGNGTSQAFEVEAS